MNHGRMNNARMVKIAKALADPTRLEILRAIQGRGELNCSQICEKFPLSQPTISHHVRTLESAGLISIRKEAQFHILAAEQGVLREFAMLLAPEGKRKPAAARGRRTSESTAGARKKAARRV